MESYFDRESPEAIIPVVTKSQTMLQNFNESSSSQYSGGGSSIIVGNSSYTISFILPDNNKIARNSKRMYEAQVRYSSKQHKNQI